MYIRGRPRWATCWMPSASRVRTSTSRSAWPTSSRRCAYPSSGRSSTCATALTWSTDLTHHLCSNNMSKLIHELYGQPDGGAAGALLDADCFEYFLRALILGALLLPQALQPPQAAVAVARGARQRVHAGGGGAQCAHEDLHRHEQSPRGVPHPRHLLQLQGRRRVYCEERDPQLSFSSPTSAADATASSLMSPTATGCTSTRRATSSSGRTSTSGPRC